MFSFNMVLYFLVFKYIIYFQQHNLIYVLINIDKFNRLIMLLKDWDKITKLLKARISFGRTALHRKLTFPRLRS